MKTTFLFSAGLFALLLTGCGGEESAQTNETSQPAPPQNVDTLRLSARQLESVNVELVGFETRPLRPVINATGRVSLLPDSKAGVHSEIEGHIDAIYVREGQFVQKGQTLIKLTSMEFLELQNQYLAAKSEADFLEVEFNRQEELKKSNIGVLAEYQNTEAKRNAALARIQALKAKLDLLGISTKPLDNPRTARVTPVVNVKAPISGSVYRVHKNLGTAITSNDLLVDLINPDKYEAKVFVYENDADLIRVGQAVELTFASEAIPPVVGKVQYISQSLDAENRTLTLHVNFKLPGNRRMLLSEMAVRAKIVGVTERSSPGTLPRTAILNDGEASYIFATTQPNAERIPLRKFKVQIQNQGEDFVQVDVLEKLPMNAKVANKNILALEAERKKNE